jgi:hypothetical protein
MAFEKNNPNYRHPQFEDRFKHWLFLQNSYQGGIAYKSEDYLTRYVNETDDEYRKRVEQTPFDNHCKSIVSIYNSFLFRKPPHRNFGTYANDPMLNSFLDDADREGRSLDDFMSEVNIVSTIFGHAWVIVDKPDITVNTRAQEIENDIRPYLTLFNPLQVLDWDYKQYPNGSYYLAYLKIWEYGDIDSYIVKKFYQDRIEREFIEKDEIVNVEIYPNNLGIIPAVSVYSQRSPIRGIGVSDISDIADVQRAIFDSNSEIEQIIRLSNHPSLVITPDVKASAGAGAIIQMPDGLDSGLKPYLLQPSAASIDSVRNIIADRVETINRMANVGAVRQQESKKISGVALEQEFELLNARLAEKANNLELGEYQIWELYALWTGMRKDFVELEYANSYNTRDKHSDFALLKEAKEVLTNSPTLYKIICLQMAELFVEDSEQLEKISKELDTPQASYDTEKTEDHPTTTPENRQEHIQTMIMDGYTDAEILRIHPEITSADILSAKADLLEVDNGND